MASWWSRLGGKSKRPTEDVPPDVAAVFEKMSKQLFPKGDIDIKRLAARIKSVAPNQLTLNDAESHAIKLSALLMMDNPSEWRLVQSLQPNSSLNAAQRYLVACVVLQHHGLIAPPSHLDLLAVNAIGACDAVSVAWRSSASDLDQRTSSRSQLSTIETVYLVLSHLVLITLGNTGGADVVADSIVEKTLRAFAPDDSNFKVAVKQFQQRFAQYKPDIVNILADTPDSKIAWDSLGLAMTGHVVGKQSPLHAALFAAELTPVLIEFAKQVRNLASGR